MSLSLIMSLASMIKERYFNYMTFTSIVKSEPVEENEKFEDLEQLDSLNEGCDD